MSGFPREPVCRLLVDPPASWVGVCFVCYGRIRLGVEIGPKEGDTYWLCAACIDRAAMALRAVRERGDRSEDLGKDEGP